MPTSRSYRKAGSLVMKAKQAERRSDWDEAIGLYEEADEILDWDIRFAEKSIKDVEKEQRYLHGINDYAERRQPGLERALKGVEKNIKRDKGRF